LQAKLVLAIPTRRDTGDVLDVVSPVESAKTWTTRAKKLGPPAGDAPCTPPNWHSR